MEQRPRRRHQRGGALFARRGERPVLVPDPLAVPGPDRSAHRHPSRLRLQRLRAQPGRHSYRADIYVDLNAPVKFSVLKVRNDSGRLRRLVGHGLRGMGAGGRAGQDRTPCGHRRRSRYRRALRAQPLQHGVLRTGRVPGHGRQDGDRDRRPNRVSGAQWHHAKSGGHDSRVPLGQARGHARSLRRHPGSLRALPRARTREIIFRLGVGRNTDDAANLVHRHRGSAAARTALEIGVAVLETHLGRGASGNARPHARRAGQWLAGVPNPGVPAVGAQRLLPVGRRLRLSRPVARRDGAHSLRAAPAARAIAHVRGPSVP
jgi:hypothetical protein